MKRIYFIQKHNLKCDRRKTFINGKIHTKKVLMKSVFRGFFTITLLINQHYSLNLSMTKFFLSPKFSHFFLDESLPSQASKFSNFFLTEFAQKNLDKSRVCLFLSLKWLILCPEAASRWKDRAYLKFGFSGFP